MSNVDEYGELSSPDKKFNEFDGPYFKQDTMAEHLEEIKTLKQQLMDGKAYNRSMRLIYCDNKMVGYCNWYWASKETNWLEVGLGIFDDNNWGKGLGTLALSKWIDYVLDLHPEIVRIGLSTWSGNIGMMRVSEKLGLKQEACYKKARIVKGEYYDSVSYGILREEWKK